jgi:hypothetical protein
MEISELYLSSVIKQMHYYKTIGEKAMDQIDPEQLFIATSDDSNSISAIVQHLCGNMLSRWTNFLTSDGEKEWRERDAEFETNITSKEDVVILWKKGWDCFFQAIEALKPEDLSQIIYIRNEGQTAIDAINRQVAHYPYHIGQIVFYAKQLKKSDWDSLSIPKNKIKQIK